MQSKIKQITLLDGKQIFYPSEEELKHLWHQVEIVLIEEWLTKAEYDKMFVYVEPLVLCQLINDKIEFTPIDPKDYYK